MKTYKNDDYRLYTAANNGTAGFMVLESRTESRYLVFDWDLSDKEIADIAGCFYAGILSDYDFQSDDWMDGDFREKEDFTWSQEADEYVKGIPADYTVFWVGGKRDGETLSEFCDLGDAIRFAHKFYREHEEELDSTDCGVGIVDRDNNAIEGDW